MKTSEIVKFYALIFIVLLTSCKTSFYTQKNSPEDNPENGIIYVLPKSKLIITAEITKEIKEKGIFADYTHLYFNTKNAVLRNSTKFYISDISVKTIPVIDSSQIYRIISPKNINPLLLNLSKGNFISGINLSDIQAGKVNTEQNKIQNQNTKTDISDYADISLHSVREVRYDTIYKEVLKDSVMIKIPVIRKKEVYKSKAKQAKEIAEIIFNLRDDKYALLTGENDGNNFPDGEALKQMLSKLSELERNYMSLFTGREIKIKKNYQFEFIPDNKSGNKSNILFYFSEKKGITKDTTDTPVVLNLYDLKPQISKPELQEKNKGIIYRIPGKAEISILLNTKNLYKTELEIPQLGSLNIIPAKLFKSRITVEFYPELGALKRISK